MSDYDWSKYETLRDRGVAEQEVFRQAVEDGFRPFPDCIRMLKDVFKVDLARAKEISLQADGVATSLYEHEASFIPALEELLRESDREESEEEESSS